MNNHTKVSILIFCLTVTIKLSVARAVPEVVKFHVDWGGINRTQLLNFARAIKNITHRLFLRLSHIGGRLSSTSVVDGYTKIKKDGHIFRANPYYINKGCQYDWTYFN